MPTVESIPGVDLEKLAPWVSEHVVPVDLRDESRSFSATIVVAHWTTSATPPIEMGGIRTR